MKHEIVQCPRCGKMIHITKHGKIEVHYQGPWIKTHLANRTRCKLSGKRVETTTTTTSNEESNV